MQNNINFKIIIADENVNSLHQTIPTLSRNRFLYYFSSKCNYYDSLNQFYIYHSKWKIIRKSKLCSKFHDHCDIKKSPENLLESNDGCKIIQKALYEEVKILNFLFNTSVSDQDKLIDICSKNLTNPYLISVFEDLIIPAFLGLKIIGKNKTKIKNIYLILMRDGCGTYMVFNTSYRNDRELFKKSGSKQYSIEIKFIAQ